MSKSRHPRAAAPAGTITRASGRWGPQVTQTSGRFWTDEAEAIFLDTLSACANVARAAAASGFSETTCYRRRRTDAGFARRWEEALQQGYAVLEAALLARAIELAQGAPAEPGRPFPDMSVREAISILNAHRAAVKGIGHHPVRRARPRSLDEVRDSILRKLGAIEARRLAEEAEQRGAADGL
jgi:hypothetical protein